jgi:hypothetical protein
MYLLCCSHCDYLTITLDGEFQIGMQLGKSFRFIQFGKFESFVSLPVEVNPVFRNTKLPPNTNHKGQYQNGNYQYGE